MRLLSLASTHHEKLIQDLRNGHLLDVIEYLFTNHDNNELLSKFYKTSTRTTLRGNQERYYSHEDFPTSTRRQKDVVCMVKVTISKQQRHNIRGDQGQNRRTDQPGRKRHPGGEKQAISLRNSRPAGEIAVSYTHLTLPTICSV